MASRPGRWQWFVVIPLFFTAIGVIAVFTYLLTWPPHPIHSVTMNILDNPTAPGSRVRFEAELCKEVRTASVLHYGMLNLGTMEYIAAGVEFGINDVGCFNIVQHFHVPIDAPLGEYQVDVVAHVKVNPLREEKYRLPMGILNVEETE